MRTINWSKKDVILSSDLCYNKNTYDDLKILLTSRPRCLRIIAHQPFAGKDKAVRENFDIASTTTVFENLEHRMRIAETDAGRQIQTQIDDLRQLLAAYRSGVIPENHNS